MLKQLNQPEPAPPWSFPAAVGALVAAFLAIIIGTGLAQTVLGDTESPATVMTGWAIGAVLAVVFVMVSRGRRGKAEASALRIGRRAPGLPLLLLFSVGMAILFDLVSWVVSGDQALAAAELIGFNRQPVSTGDWLLALVYMGALQSAADELVLRGMLFPSLRSALGPWTSILMSGLFHAAFHFAAFPPSGEAQTVTLWFGLGLPLLDGLYFSAVRATTGSTRAAIFAHAMFGIFRVLKVFALTG